MPEKCPPPEVSINTVSSAAHSALKVVKVREQQSTFSPRLPQLPILDEPCEHLRLHEDTQETANTFRSHRFAESLPLEEALSALVLSDKQGVVADGLEEEANKGL